MAIFHVSMKIYSRAKGHSAIAAAAYRAGVALTDDRTGVLHDYSRRRGVECARVIAPSAVPAWACIARLWNAMDGSRRSPEECPRCPRFDCGPDARTERRATLGTRPGHRPGFWLSGTAWQPWSRCMRRTRAATSGTTTCTSSSRRGR